ncbi:MAG: Rrf2 family transcriptional regulator [Elusimicrobia bacterium]|nr:Rrf2 family transcriptional regulator [Elusimicrobiota bacterium]
MPGILNLSEASAIGAHAMMLLARGPREPLRVPELAARLKVSAAHLQKVLQRLAHAGLARSTRGPKGGYALAKPAASIRLGDVFQAIEGSLPLGACLLDKERCCMGECVLGDLLRSVNEAVARRLRTRLSELSPADGAANSIPDGADAPSSRAPSGKALADGAGKPSGDKRRFGGRRPII